MARKNAEELLAKQLEAEGIGFEREFRFHPVRKWRADFRLTEYLLLIEVEGVSYAVGGASRHQMGRGYEEDCVKYNEASIEGWWVLRFTPDMVLGRARGRGKRKYPPAIETIKRWIRQA